ncbi:MAG TPA: hypothetical protein DD670_19985, partial [Planctomycetaceae bacterium]|nr:hypothetical protein [Planctomycetaceae bacterium]
INLAMVHRHLGDSQLAESIERQAATLAAAGRRAAPHSARPAPPVEWIAPQEFAGSYADATGPWQPAPVKREPASVAPTAPVEQASRGWSWNPFQKQQ